VKLPFVSRSRYERELQQLREAYSVSTKDLRERLTRLIESVTFIRMGPSISRDEKMVSVTVRLPSMVKENFMFSPFQREEYWWHVGQNIVEQLKAHAMLRDSESENPPHHLKGGG
jgi:hypothetical protein